MLVLFIASLLLTGACGKSETETTTDGSAINQLYPEGSDLPELRMTADVSEAAPGDLITVTWSASNAENLACLQFKAFYDDKAFSLYETEEANVKDLISNSNSIEGQVVYTGVCTTTVDVIEETVLFTITLQVKDDAVAGEHAVSCMVNQFMLGTDDRGDEIANLVDIKDLDTSLVITVIDDTVVVFEPEGGYD